MTISEKRKSYLKRFAKWSLILGVLFLISLFAIPSIFNDAISNEIKKGVNAQLETELHFKSSNISFFTHFPSLTFSFEDVDLASTAPFSDQSLVKAKELGFGVNVFKLIFSDKVEINETYLSDCNITLIKDRFGRDNYSVYKSTDSTTTAVDSTSSTLNLNLNHLKIENASIVYKDEAVGISILSNGLNYNGKGDLDAGQLKLGSKLDIDSVDVVFDTIDYLKGKKLRAKSFTVYDTNNLSIALDENNISLNELDIYFDGQLNVFDDGFAYDLVFNTRKSNLKDLASALPPEYAEWSKAVTLDGDLDASFHLAGFTGTVPNTHKKSHTEIAMAIENGTIKHNEADEAVENLYLKFNGDFQEHWTDLKVDTLDFTLNNERTTGKIVLKGKPDSLYINSNISSKLNLKILNKTLNLPDLTFDGLLASDCYVEGLYQPSASKFPKTKGVFKVSDGYLKTSGFPEPIKGISILATANNEGYNYASSSLDISTLQFTFLNNPFSAKASFSNFDNPTYDISATGTVDFSSLNQVVPLPFLFSEGIMVADVKLKGQLNGTETDNVHSGSLDLNNVTIQSDFLQAPFLIQSGKFLFLNEQMGFTNLEVAHGSSKAVLDGYFKNYLDYALYSKGLLRGDIMLKSSKIDITEFFPKGEQLAQAVDSTATVTTTETVVSGVMQMPKKLDLSLQVAIDSLLYNSLTITKLSGTLGMTEEGLFLKNSDLEMVDGTAQLEGFYRPLSETQALFAMQIKAEDLNLEKGYQSIELFKELAPAAEKASGIVSVDYDIEGTLDQDMTPNLPSLKGEGTLKVHSVQFDGYTLLGKLSKKSGFDALNDPKVSEITIKSSVANNVLNLERFKFKVRPFRLRAEGQTSLDGELSLKMRVGLPPFGIIGVPIVVKGNSEDFDITLGRKSPDLDTLEDNDSDYSEDDLLRMQMLKDSIRSGMSLKAINAMQERIEKVNLDSLRAVPVDTLQVKL